ncbi:MAG: aminotransferase class V-fold PLP-dependent enzyme [Planctomycetota bacterium]
MTGPGGVFCDWNAGAPPEPEVLDRYLEVERQCPANPASLHTPGRRARGVLEQARDRIAAALGVPVTDVVFTSGGTEAANLAVRGLGDPVAPVLLGPVEHPAVREAAEFRSIVEWEVDGEGFVRVAVPDQPVGLLALVHAQSELGTLQPIVAAAELATTLRSPLFVDAAQTLGRVDLAPVVAHATAFALSPHKCGGLRGHGVLVVRDAAAALRPLLRGGGQEAGLRPGTQSPALAAANALAIDRAVHETSQRAHRMLGNRTAFLAALAASGTAHRVLTPLAHSVPNTAMIAFPNVDGRNLLPALDLAGVFASFGNACSSGSPEPPRVLQQMGLPIELARACVRFSFGWRDDATGAALAGRRVGDVVRGRAKKIDSPRA